MGGEFADREKRPESVPQDWMGPTSSKAKTSQEQDSFLGHGPKFGDPPSPNDSRPLRRIDSTPEGAERLRQKILADPARSWLLEPDGKPPTPEELSRMRRVDSTPEGAERLRQKILADPERSWLLEPNGKPPTPEELAQMRREKRVREAQQQQSINQQDEGSLQGQFPGDGVKVASTELTPGMLEPQPQLDPSSKTQPFKGAEPVLMANAATIPIRGINMPTETGLGGINLSRDNLYRGLSGHFWF